MTRRREFLRGWLLQLPVTDTEPPGRPPRHRPALRAWPGADRGDAVDGARGARPDDRLDRGAVDRADLGGFRQFPWLFSVYLLAQAATVPVYGKLADQFGRKPLMYYGIGVFLLGSVLCAAGLEHAGADRRARPAGPRRGRRAADRDDDHRRHLHAARARQGAGVRRQRLGHLVGDRPDVRRRCSASCSAGGSSSGSTSRCACWRRGCCAASPSGSSAATSRSTTPAPRC